LTEISNNNYKEPRQRQLFKNIIYIGALSLLLGIDADVFEKLFAEQYKGNEVIEIAKGKYHYPKSNVQLFKKLLKWQ
jgi:Pyruvate/2-oxoacid:ferredoxin oxidoreductase gamma subunit